jgi:hypothetical protein
MQKPGAGSELQKPGASVVLDCFCGSAHCDTLVFEPEAAIPETTRRAVRGPESLPGGRQQNDLSGFVQHPVGRFLHEAVVQPGGGIVLTVVEADGNPSG